MLNPAPIHNKSFYAVNAITFYRLAITPVLIFLIFTGRQNVFAIMLAVSFFTDLIDGYLARRYNATSIFGSRLDSIADDLTFLSAIIGVLVLKFSFIAGNILLVGIVLGFYLLQTVFALARYHKISSFHTYLAKVAAIFQGTFLILIFFLNEPPYTLFYLACFFTILDLLEEIILVFMLPHWRTNVKGIYWIINKKRNGGIS